MKTKSIFIAMMLVVFTFLVGCNSNNQASDGSEKLNVYTTIFPLEDFTKKIGGEHVEVTSVYPPGADAHTFEPSTRTMSEMASADAFIYSGVGAEGFADKAKGVLENEDVKVVAAGHGIELRGEDDHDHEEEAHNDDHDHEHEEEAHGDDHDHENEEEAHGDDHDHEHEEEAHGDDHDHEHEEEAHGDDHDHEHEEEAHGDDHDHEHEEEAHEDDHDHEHEEDGHEGHDHSDGDPHVWLDPTLSISLAENIKNALVELKPEAKEDFEANFETLKADLEELDAEFKETVDTANTNKILVSHAAYGYWEHRYGLEQISVTGLSPTQEPSQKQLTEIIDTAKENEIQYVIFDQNISGKIAEVVKNEIKAEALVLHNLEALTEEDINNEEDYFSLMRQNLETLKKALN
ncbi:metal ABC transporter solute-binding protein, Zn/Mn family [Sutcliffiella horikoshii]|uniref:metal ABC transporter solute-binding protein, Zn/Mn family n=1 Tax=Sutcliffiella horikoshii TaxID=79883 RepID=UPI001F2CADFB|nr:zinc ABC transporter substrate-binding protein [Sutcliffiella horikoshii]MCG1021921.1 ABC transporter substrate-binding protein [Sutcliffiella horikoshii]